MNAELDWSRQCVWCTKQPKAYDVDKVCEQLERLRRIAFVTVANTDNEENDKIYSYLSEMVDDAIDIVKRGVK